MNVLIVAPAWVGDMVMAGSLLATLQRLYPTELNIDLLAPPATAPLGGRMPGVRNTHVLDIAHGELGIGKRRTLARTLRQHDYDRAIVLPNSFKSALTPYWAGIPRRTGWTAEARYVVLNDRRNLVESSYPLMIERFMALALDAGARLTPPYPHPVLNADTANADDLSERFTLAKQHITVIVPGAEFGAAKRWPAEHYAAVARHETERGQQVWLLGSAADRDVCRQIESLAQAGLKNLAGRTSLTDALDLISLCDKVVCNDSGLMHVAAALGRRLIAVYGSTSPDFTPPLAASASIISNPLPCSPCFQRECPLGHLKCLRELAPSQVIEVL